MGSDRLIKKLREQIQYLSNSAFCFDAGDQSEANRLAVTLRVLFHQTASSTALVNLLKWKGVEVLSSPRSKGDALDFVNIEINLGNPLPVSAIPKLSEAFNVVKLADWWGTEQVHAFQGRTYFRRDFIL